jgi:hypothetical protein
LVSRPASPFQAQGEISPGKNIGLRCAIIGSTSRRLGHESFAVSGPLVLPGSAFYPIPVRRPGASLPASFTPASRNDALRFASLAVNASTLPISAHGARRRRLRPGIGDAEAVDAVLGATAAPKVTATSRRVTLYAGWKFAICLSFGYYLLQFLIGGASAYD